MKEIKITGKWDGQPIWREVTASEKLVELLELQNKKQSSYFDNNISGKEFDE